MRTSTSNGDGILVVEDSRTQAEQLQQVLRESFPSRSIRHAINGREALDCLKQRRPALVISDVVMPEMDGYEMCRRMKQDPSLRAIPVVLLTSLSDAEDIIKGLNAGTDYYLTKPFEQNFLVNKIGAILDNLDGPESKGDSGWLVKFGGRSHVVQADLQQMLNLLLSTYENAVQQNKQLLAVQEELRKTNERLEERVRERTKELSTTNKQLRVEIGERTRAEDQLRVQLQRLDALRQIDAAITSSMDIRVTLDVLLDQVVSQLHVDAADVLLLRPHSLELEFAAGRGFSTGRRVNNMARFGSVPAHRAARERQVVKIEDLQNSDCVPRPRDFVDAEGFITYMAVPLTAKGRSVGVLELFHREPFNESLEWIEFLESLAGQAAIAIDSALMFERVQQSNAELLDAYDTTLRGWSHALDLRDKETEGHSMRVTQMTERIARHMRVSDGQLVHMRRGALLHDIGKLAVPDDILRKPGPLNDQEREIMERHPVHAYEMLAPIGFLSPALDIPYAHHEKWDGSGYPRGLKGEQIPLAARIFAVADVWDALRSDRPYREGWPRARVLTYICEQSGSHFDANVVESFQSLVESLGDEIDSLPDLRTVEERDVLSGRRP